jgi:hypothetical protein
MSYANDPADRSTTTPPLGHPISAEALAAYARDLPAPPPIRRLEVGPGVVDGLRTHVPAPLTLPDPVALLTGIPIVETKGLEPGAWRLLDGDDRVIREGVLPKRLASRSRA